MKIINFIRCLFGKHQAMYVQHFLQHLDYCYYECVHCDRVKPIVYQNSMFARTHWDTKKYWEQDYSVYARIWGENWWGGRLLHTRAKKSQKTPL